MEQTGNTQQTAQAFNEQKNAMLPPCAGSPKCSGKCAAVKLAEVAATLQTTATATTVFPLQLVMI